MLKLMTAAQNAMNKFVNVISLFGLVSYFKVFSYNLQDVADRDT
jgi:hypothetical protein